jgi:hypothetical protein
MHLEIVEIDWDTPVEAAGTTQSYWARFRSELGEIDALFYSDGGRRLPPGDNVSVEILQSSVFDFTIVNATAPSMSAGERPGEFLLVGLVNTVVENGAGQAFGLDVDVGGLRFWLDPEVDTDGVVAHKGQWVSFRVDGLSLWDTYEGR